MISEKWQRRAPKNPEETNTPGAFSRLGARMKRATSSLMFESVDPASIKLPIDQVDNGPFGRVGPNTAQAIKRGLGTVGRTASSPFGALVTVTVADGHIRVLTARGNRVRAWAESDLPTGVVQDGLIVDEQTFIEVFGEVLKQVTRNGKLNGQKVAVAITGRNMVQRRLTVFVDDDQNLAEAIVSASSDSMSIRPEEMQIEWDVEEFDLVEDEDDEETDDEFGDDELDDEDLVGTGDDVAVPEVVDAPVAPETSEEIGLENLNLDMAPEPDGDPYDVYALAVHKHVIRRNLRTVSEFSGRFAGVQPKILTLAAAVNSRDAVMVDIEPSTMITSVVSNGLPEVIREVGLDQDMSHVQWVNLVRTQISRAVSFYDSLFPEDTLGLDVDVFVTGEFERSNRAIDEALETLPYVRAELPQTLRAPNEFSFEKYASNVGLVIVSGKRFWQRAPVHLLQTPKFDFRPIQYRPRPIPVRAAMNIAAALILSFGLFTAFGLFTEQTESTAATQQSLGVLEQRVQLRTLKLEQTRGARATLNESKMKTERLIAANDVIQDRDAGFAYTALIIEEMAPSDVTITTIDDDGRRVAVEAKSGDYSTLLAYIRVLEDIPQFVHVQVLSLGKSLSDDSGNAPAAGPDGSAQAGSVVQMFIEITRIEINDSEILSNEELAVAKTN